MSTYTICLIALLAGALGPALVISARGEPNNRLVGLELASSVAVFVLILFSQVAQGQSYDLVLPLVLVPMSFAGTLVFTRLMARHPDQSE